MTTPSALRSEAGPSKAENAPASPFKYDVIPDRIESSVTLKVMASQLKSVGDGVFALEVVKAGELIFCVKQPLLNIVSRIHF